MHSLRSASRGGAGDEQASAASAKIASACPRRRQSDRPLDGGAQVRELRSCRPLHRSLPEGYARRSAPHAVDQDHAEIVDVGLGRPALRRDRRAPAKKRRRIVVGQQCGRIEVGAAARASVSGKTQAPAGSVGAPPPPSMPSVSAASAAMPAAPPAPWRAPAHIPGSGRRAPLPVTVTVSSPPDRIATRAAAGLRLAAPARHAPWRPRAPRLPAHRRG